MRIEKIALKILAFCSVLTHVRADVVTTRIDHGPEVGMREKDVVVQEISHHLMEVHLMVQGLGEESGGATVRYVVRDLIEGQTEHVDVMSGIIKDLLAEFETEKEMLMAELGALPPGYVPGAETFRHLSMKEVTEVLEKLCDTPRFTV